MLQDLSVLEIGDFKGSKEMEPALTTIHFPAEGIGGLAGREMCGLIAQSEGSKTMGQLVRRKCQISLAERATCLPIRRPHRSDLRDLLHNKWDFAKKPRAPLPMRHRCAKLFRKPK